MKSSAIAIIVAGLSVASCGSGGGTTNGGPAIVPGSPTPSPSTSPSPSPSPSPTYTTFANLTGDQTYQSACSNYLFSAPVPDAFLATPYGQGIGLSYQASTQTYAAAGDGFSLTFGPADVDPAAPTTAIAYVKPGAIGSDRFNISRPGIAGVGLDYARAAIVQTSRFGTRVTYYCVIGVQTRLTDVPAASVVNFTQNVIGATAYDSSSGATIAYSLSKSTVTFSVNLTTGNVVPTIHMIGTPAPVGGVTGPDVDLGTVTGSGTIDASTGGFYGQWSSTDREAIGYFSGTFFGPQGAEFGMAYGFSGRNSSANRIFASAGTAFGKR